MDENIKTYEIKKGDNLSKIAKVYDTTVDVLVEANNIKDPNLIFVGDNLIIPGVEDLEMDPTTIEEDEVTSEQIVDQFDEENPVQANQDAIEEAKSEEDASIVEEQEETQENVEGINETDPLEDSDTVVYDIDEEVDRVNLQYITDNYEVEGRNIDLEGEADYFKNQTGVEGADDIFFKNVSKVLTGFEGVEEKFAEDDKGYTFQISHLGGSGHKQGNKKPTHFSGAKADVYFYKDGVKLNGNNITDEDIRYIKEVLQANNLDMQYEYTSGGGWGDCFIKEGALNVNGEDVAYGDEWGKDNKYAA